MLCLAAGYPVAYTIARAGRWKNLLLFLIVMPLWTSFLVRTYAMIFLLRDTGFVNTVLLAAGVIREPLTLLYTPGAVLAGLVYGYLPLMILPIYVSIEKLDPTLLEAAEVLGARPAARFWRVTLPLTAPGVVAGSLLVFIPALGAFLTPGLLGGAKQMMIGTLVQNQFGPPGAELALRLRGVVHPDGGRAGGGAGVPPAPRPLAGGGDRMTRRLPRSLVAFTALCFFFLHGPVLVLAVFSFNHSRFSVQWTGFSLEWYRRLLARPDILAALKVSLIVGTVSTLVATALGTLLALALARHRFRGRTMLEGLLYLPIVTPEIVMGISLLLLFATLRLGLGIPTIVVAHVAFSISFVAVVVRARLEGMDRSLEEAALTLGADEVETFRRVTLPLLWPGILAGALLALRCPSTTS